MSALSAETGRLWTEKLPPGAAEEEPPESPQVELCLPLDLPQPPVVLLSVILLGGEVGPGFQGNVSTHVALTNSKGPKQHSGLPRVSYP